MTLANEAQPPVKVVLLDLEMTNELAVPSMDMLAELHEELDRQEVELWLARLHETVYEALKKSGILQQIGQDKIHPRNLDSIVEYLSRIAPDELEDMALVNDGLNLTLEVIDRLLSLATGEQRQVLEGFRQKLAEISRAAESGPGM